MELIVNPWVTHIAVVVIALLLGLYVGQVSEEKDIDEIEELRFEKSTLESKISNLEEQLYTLEENVEEKRNMVCGIQDTINDLLDEQNEIKKGQSFSKVQRDALDLYERAGVRLSADILEELYYHRDMKTVAEVKQFIENQRVNWKLENSKKI